MHGASLEIKGRKITTKSLHKFPKELDIFTITSKKEGNVIGFFGELNALLNFHPAKFELDGINYPTSEHYIQYTKAMVFGDKTAAANILSANTPVDSKSIGWKITSFDKSKWDENAKRLCYPGICEKFLQNKQLLDTLLRTKGHILVESAKDKVWGTGIVLARDDWYDDTLWNSQGILGEMLCEIRDTYLANHPDTIVQSLSYDKKPLTIPERPMSLNLPNRSKSTPELASLPGVPQTPASNVTGEQIQPPTSSLSTTTSVPNLHGLPDTWFLTNMPCTNPNHPGSNQHLDHHSLPAVPSHQLITATPPNSLQTNYTPLGITQYLDQPTLQAVPSNPQTVGTPLSNTRMDTSITPTPNMTPTQAALLSLSETEVHQSEPAD